MTRTTRSRRCDVAHPIPGFRVTTPWGTEGAWAAGYHTGDDYSTHGRIGIPVHATKDGTVVLVSRGTGGWGEPYGKHVVIESGDVRHGYCHLSRIRVRVGDPVSAAERIGLSGNTGNTTGAHLHYEERTTPFRYDAEDRKPKFSSRTGPGTSVPVGEVKVSHLHQGQADSNSVRRLQDVLNGLSLSGQLLDVTGNYGDKTAGKVRRYQRHVLNEPEMFCTGNLDLRQAILIFDRTGNAVVDA